MQTRQAISDSAASSMPAPSVRELQAARDVAQSLLTADSPAEVYQLALERVAPLTGAAFASVFLHDPEDDLLRVAASFNWPQAQAAYLGQLRIRPGNGPTGQAFTEAATVEIPDIFADPALEDWWEAARELGFASSISVPLVLRGRAVGALTLYFRERSPLGDADRQLLRLVADQLAATAEKAHLITDLQRANGQLIAQNLELQVRWREAEEARRMRTEFLANVSHELRTPLTAIAGYSYLLREGASGALSPEQTDAVNRIEKAGAALLAKINDLLELTHLKLGRTTLEPEACDAVALARTAGSALPSPPASVAFRFEAPAAPVPVYTDAAHTLRILRNLLANAMKFTSNGTVTLAVRLEPGSRSRAPASAVWEVRDTGIGIDPRDQEAIFDEFRQVDGSLSRRYEGMGLGLALSRQLARRLGGEISVRSNPGEGAVFTFRLPSTVDR